MSENEKVVHILLSENVNSKRSLVRGVFTDNAAAETALDRYRSVLQSKVDGNSPEIWIVSAMLDAAVPRWWHVSFEFKYLRWKAKECLGKPTDPYEMDYMEGFVMVDVIADNEAEALQRGKNLVRMKMG